MSGQARTAVVRRLETTEITTEKDPSRRLFHRPLRRHRHRHQVNDDPEVEVKVLDSLVTGLRKGCHLSSSFTVVCLELHLQARLLLHEKEAVDDVIHGSAEAMATVVDRRVVLPLLRDTVDVDLRLAL